MSTLSDVADTVSRPAGGPLAGVCANCANPSRTRYCSPKCKRAFNNRAIGRGGPVIPLALAWRASRNGNKEQKAIGASCLNELCRILDLYNEEDRAEGRSTAMTIEYARKLLASGQYIDRRRKR